MKRVDLVKVDAAFKTLRQNGYIALHRFMCCRVCGWQAINERIDMRVQLGGEVINGAVFYHDQAWETANSGGNLYLHHKGYFKSDLAAASEICAALRDAGLTVTWDGRPSQMIVINNQPHN